MLRTITSLALVAILGSSAFFWRPPECQAQTRTAPADYDYYSLAVTSILNSATEAAKLPDISQRVALLLSAAKILPSSQRDDAVRLLDLALRDLKLWVSEGKASWYRRDTAATLRSEVLALYAAFDPKKATALEEEFQAAERSGAADTSAALLKTGNWFTQLNTRRNTADQAAKIALSLLESDSDKAFALVIQSIQDGMVSGVVVDIVQKLIQSGNRALLNKLEIGIGETLAENFTLDPYSLTYTSILLQSDPQAPSVMKGALVSFFMQSQRAWSDFVREANRNGRLDSSYTNMAFTMFIINVRPALMQHAPEHLPVFDSVMDQLGALVPIDTRLRLQAFQPETMSDPRDRLNDILRDPAPGRRDLRLVRLLSDVIRNKSEEIEKNIDLAADAIAGFSDSDGKSAYTDLLTITRTDRFVKQKKFIEAQQLAGSISSEETRAWALLVLSSVAAKSDRVLGFELISNALKALDKASPSPHKVELALNAVAMLAKNDPQRAFDTLATATRYANSSAAKVDPPTKPPFAFGLEARIGETQTRLGVFPESLAEIKIDPSLSALATTDWFRADQVLDNIREPSLRLKLKLLFAGAVVAEQSKRGTKQPKAKASLSH